MKKTAMKAMVDRLEKNLKESATLGMAMAQLGREILKDVRAAQAALVSFRQTELALPVAPPEPVKRPKTPRKR